MAIVIPDLIAELAHKVRNEIYGRDVREALATSMEATAEVAEWSRKVAQQIIDDGFDEGALNAAIEQKLNDLEQQYAPNLTSLESEIEDARGNESSLVNRLNSSDSQLAQKANQEDLEKTNTNLEQVAKRVNVLDRLPENLTGLIANSIIAIPEKTIPLSWNADDWELGSIATVSGAPITGTIRIRTPDFLNEVEANATYATFLATTNDEDNSDESLINFFFYKEDNSYIGSTGWLNDNQSFTTPLETSKLKVVVRNVVDNYTIDTAYIQIAKPVVSRVY
ncbi:PspA/IM30 family protein [Amphibacillus sp. Q70]|uniref:PspA/IM30 family protein n=1 Tax=Amphibacillus sp. Q70 TaxID=3453416 RepID=UPI003F87B998